MNLLSKMNIWIDALARKRKEFHQSCHCNTVPVFELTIRTTTFERKANKMFTRYTGDEKEVQFDGKSTMGDTAKWSDDFFIHIFYYCDYQNSLQLFIIFNPLVKIWSRRFKSVWAKLLCQNRVCVPISRFYNIQNICLIAP